MKLADKIIGLFEGDDEDMFNRAKANNKKIKTEINNLKKKKDELESKFPGLAEWDKIPYHSTDRSPEQKHRHAELQKEYDDYMAKYVEPINDKIKDLEKKIFKDVVGKKFK